VTKLIYIGGFGQSGTTLFEFLLTTNPKLVACGEIVNGFQKSSGEELKCSCGRLSSDCPVWSIFSHRPCGRSHTHEARVMTLLEHVAGTYAIMSDSSKTAWGTIISPFRLRRKLGDNLCLVHLVRDPRAVCWSAIRLFKRKKHKKSWTVRLWSTPILRCLRTCLGWWVANLSCEFFGWLYPTQYLRFRYENFASSPHAALCALFDKISPGTAPRLTEIGTNDNRHQIYGNRILRRPLLLSDVRLDDRWRSEMAFGYRYLAGALSWPLRTKYGY
jgi:hypothetical protein